ncbi:MAG: hypothetical protein HYV40_05985 [Candidatus Levybacteria bacterium]|nr:hypothetical protein [Candidatus Levybacteria bacterium]
MPKKKAKHSTGKKRQNTPQFSYIKITFFVSLFLVIGIVGKSMLTAEHYKVLGAKTLLARGGDDSGGDNSGSGNSGSGSSGGSSSGSSGGSGSSGSGSSGSGSSGGGSNDSGTSGSGGNEGSYTGSSTSVSDGTKVMCTGPDGRQFATEFKDCEELNNAWNKPVVFTTLPQRTTRIETRSRSSETETENEIELTETEVDAAEQENETEVSESERIRVRTKDGRERIDITSGGIKTRLEIRDDRFIIKVEQEDGTEEELEEDTLLKIDDRLGEDNIRITTAGENRFLLQTGSAAAVTKFPLSIDLSTNELFVNTPAGQRRVTVLPQQAIQGLLGANIVSKLGVQGLEDVVATGSGSESLVSQIVTLGERSGIPVYEIRGISDQMLLGFIPVEVEKNITISAETGNALSIDEPFFARILDAFSF